MQTASESMRNQWKSSQSAFDMHSTSFEQQAKMHFGRPDSEGTDEILWIGVDCAGLKADVADSGKPHRWMHM